LGYPRGEARQVDFIHGQADNNSGTFPMQSERLYAALKGLGGDFPERVDVTDRERARRGTGRGEKKQQRQWACHRVTSKRPRQRQDAIGGAGFTASPRTATG
jgi:hypothetical protein